MNQCDQPWMREKHRRRARSNSSVSSEASSDASSCSSSSSSSSSCSSSSSSSCSSASCSDEESSLPANCEFAIVRQPEQTHDPLKLRIAARRVSKAEDSACMTSAAGASSGSANGSAAVRLRIKQHKSRRRRRSRSPTDAGGLRQPRCSCMEKRKGKPCAKKAELNTAVPVNSDVMGNAEKPASMASDCSTVVGQPLPYLNMDASANVSPDSGIQSCGESPQRASCHGDSPHRGSCREDSPARVISHDEEADKKHLMQEVPAVTACSDAVLSSIPERPPSVSRLERLKLPDVGTVKDTKQHGPESRLDVLTANTTETTKSPCDASHLLVTDTPENLLPKEPLEHALSFSENLQQSVPLGSKVQRYGFSESPSEKPPLERISPCRTSDGEARRKAEVIKNSTPPPPQLTPPQLTPPRLDCMVVEPQAPACSRSDNTSTGDDKERSSEESQCPPVLSCSLSSQKRYKRVSSSKEKKTTEEVIAVSPPRLRRRKRDGEEQAAAKSLPAQMRVLRPSRMGRPPSNVNTRPLRSATLKTAAPNGGKTESGDRELQQLVQKVHDSISTQFQDMMGTSSDYDMTVESEESSVQRKVAEKHPNMALEEPGEMKTAPLPCSTLLSQEDKNEASASSGNADTDICKTIEKPLPARRRGRPKSNATRKLGSAKAERPTLRHAAEGQA
ncbi:hypothetical protein HPB51_014603 [Rhipicephalus microplus]|uniref:Uncharacterized protein n=1 Tax=Rhipicephalus microplus TaxID=6941 RepID=A0A9J6F3E4_RHIMP|nr:hypothetical protein HPB51_014603 [Rhipicephalus microplus]